MERASIAHPALAQPDGCQRTPQPRSPRRCGRSRRSGAHDAERALDLACERLAQSIAAAERLRGELRARRAELRALENRMHITSEMLCEGVLVFDPHGRVVYANNAAGRILQHEPRPTALPPRPRPPLALPARGRLPLAARRPPDRRDARPGRSRRAVTVGVLGPGGAVTWIAALLPARAGRVRAQVGAIATFADISERRTILEQLQHQAHHDQLTDLANRRLFHKELDRAISRAQRHGCAVALVYMDLNGFKQVNDTLGHRAGDAVLRALAERLGGAIREDELISRYGGDEFVALLSMLRHPTGEVQAFMERMRRTLAEPIRIEAGAVKVGASLGASVYPHDGSTAEQLLHHADAAMFAMKGSRLAA